MLLQMPQSVQLILRNFHNNRLFEIAEVFTEQREPAAMLGVFFHFYLEFNRIAVKQVQVVESDLIVLKNIIYIYAFPVNRKFFQLPELRTGYGPVFGREFASFPSEVAGRSIG